MFKRVMVLLLVLTCLAAGSTALASGAIGDDLRFIPTQIKVTAYEIDVQGYFVNMNPYYSVSSFTNFNMDLYYSGQLLASANFGALNYFTVRPKSLCAYEFRYLGRFNLNPGTYSCDDYYTCAFSANFKCSG